MPLENSKWLPFFKMAAIIGITTFCFTEWSDFDYLWVHLYVFEVAEAEFITVEQRRSLHLSSLVGQREITFT